MLWLLLLKIWVSCFWLGHSEVVPSFEMSCPQYFYQNITANGLQPQKPAWICQKYKNKTYFATLYDRDLRIPVYSAYIYQPANISTNRTWMVEPQLICQNLSRNMETEWTLINKYNISQEQINQSQAVSKDYHKLMGLDRGHLNPCSHHNNKDTKVATCTLTNIVPQNSSLNKGMWNNYEQRTMPQKSQNCTITYVLVGAVPGDKYIANGRVNVPSHIWASACCKMKNKTVSAWAAIAENDKNQVYNLTLGQLETRLPELYKRGQVSLFHSDCPRN